MKVRSGKAKGRRFEQKIHRDICLTLGLSEEVLIKVSASCTGSDIRPNSKIKDIFPFSIECKNTESLKLYQTIQQAEKNAKKEKNIPLIVFKRNREQPRAIINWDILLYLIKIALNYNYEARNIWENRPNEPDKCTNTQDYGTEEH